MPDTCNQVAFGTIQLRTAVQGEGCDLEKTGVTEL